MKQLPLTQGLQERDQILSVWQIYMKNPTDIFKPYLTEYLYCNQILGTERIVRCQHTIKFYLLNSINSNISNNSFSF